MNPADIWTPEPICGRCKRPWSSSLHDPTISPPSTGGHAFVTDDCTVTSGSTLVSGKLRTL